uniref:Retroviral polymerase SH3-like domain-containing protein n=1 Tax=Physcomitrium patens TaxID=3218 RepID=A0A2K1ICD6_PHYPA|nr:hypothetical protein PHYPA_030418 [Physcomitrium patens]
MTLKKFKAFQANTKNGKGQQIKDPRIKFYMMLGYNLTCKAYRLYNLNTKKMIRTKDPKFNEVKRTKINTSIFI